MRVRASSVRFCWCLGFFILAGSRASAQPGLSFMHPLQPCDAKVVRACEQAPADGRDHVYTFIVNGADPFHLSNLNGVTGYLRRLGFPQTRLEPFRNARSAGQQIRAIRQSDPDAKIVLVGFSAAALFVRRLANDLEREGITLDALVYLSGDYVGNTPRSAPSNVGKVVNIRGHGLVFSGYDLFFNGADIDNAVNVKLDSRHIVVPSQAQTLETLATLMANLAHESHASIASRSGKEPTIAAAPNRQGPVRAIPVSQPASQPGQASPYLATPYIMQTPPR